MKAFITARQAAELLGASVAAVEAAYEDTDAVLAALADGDGGSRDE